MRIAVVGAGLSGLSLAFRLQQRLPAAEILLFERDNRLGGTIGTVEENGFRLEIGPNGFLDSKPNTRDLCGALELDGRLIPASESSGKNRYLFQGKKLQALPAGMLSFLKSDLLTWRSKIGLFWERFRGRGKADDESIDAFARRRAGNQAAEVLADAVVTGIFAGDPKLLSLPACFPRLAALEREYGSVLKGLARTARQRREEAKRSGIPTQRPGKLWSFREGLGLLVEALAAQLRTPPHLGVSLKPLRREGEPQKWVLTADGRDRWQVDVVALACPAYQQAALLSEVHPQLAAEVAAIPYNRVAVIGMGFRREDVAHPLDGFGYIAPQRLRRDVLGVQWCSSIWPDRAPPGAVLVRAMCGGWHRGDVVGRDDDHLLETVRAELRTSMGIQAAPVFHRIVRWDRAIPQYQVGHLERLRRIENLAGSLPTLFLGGNAYRGVAMNDCAEQGELLAERIARRTK